MLVGHLAAGLLGTRIGPKLSLGILMVAVFLADLMVFPFLLAGLDRFEVNPDVRFNRVVGHDIAYSHSLLMMAIWGGLLSLAYFLRRRNRRGAWVLFVAVLSHWILDLVSHRPDMPLAPGLSPKFGLGLWNSIPATVVVEGGFWLVAVVLYFRSARVRGWSRAVVFWLGVVLITLIWFGNITQGMDPDPVKAAIGGLISFSLMVAWAYWVDAKREQHSGAG